jgi:hypothetical protein
MTAAIDADEGAGAGNIRGFKTNRSFIESHKRRLNLAKPLIGVVGKLFGFGMGHFDAVVFRLECVASRFLFVRQRRGVAAKLSQAVGMAVGELGCDLDPLPAFGADGSGFLFELLGNKAIDECDILQPAAVVTLEQVA